MRIAVLSDIHSNLEALEAALRIAGDRGADEIYCLGDIVGYGADPAPVVDLVREHCTGVVRGNHEEAVALDRGVRWLPKGGQKAAVHNRERLNDDQLEYLAGLPLKLTAHGCTFVHATPDEPSAWRRVDSFTILRKQFDYLETPFCFMGHTHIPAVVADRLGVLNVRPGHRYIINVGSVGQPRDRDARLAFGFFDTDEFTYELIRAPYDVDAAQKKARDAGLDLFRF